MSDPLVHVLYTNGTFVLPPDAPPTPAGRLASTPGDNVCEYAGRICYDSLYAPTARPTPDYHVNVRAERHHSVYAHVVDTFEAKFDDSPLDPYGVLSALQLRPGVWVTRADPDRIRFCLSLRAVIEWADHGCAPDDRWASAVYAALIRDLKPLYPMALAGLPVPGSFGPAASRVRKVAPETDYERWCSLLISGVSRDLLQELVRHHWQANPSVRSTRYCDESGARCVDHPFLTGPALEAAERARTASREAYTSVYEILTQNRVPKKTARGAARSCLTGATETKLVFSLSLFQARHLWSQRSAAGAEPEIRRLADAIRTALDPVWGRL